LVNSRTVNEYPKPSYGLTSFPGTRWGRLLIFVAALALIYFLGTSLFSNRNSAALIRWTLEHVFHHSSSGQIFFLNNWLRWSAHYLEFFVLFLMLAVWPLRLSPLTALIITVALGAADEGHQYFIPDRSCSLSDLELDSAGAATAFILTVALRRIRGVPRAPANPASEETEKAARDEQRSISTPVPNQNSICEAKARVLRMGAVPWSAWSLWFARLLRCSCADFRSRGASELEVVALRDQLTVLRRQRPGRPRLRLPDRVFCIRLYRLWPGCLRHPHFAEPARADSPVAPRTCRRPGNGHMKESAGRKSQRRLIAAQCLHNLAGGLDVPAATW
jgi:VanZ family protein